MLISPCHKRRASRASRSGIPRERLRQKRTVATVRQSELASSARRDDRVILNITSENRELARQLAYMEATRGNNRYSHGVRGLWRASVGRQYSSVSPGAPDGFCNASS